MIARLRELADRPIAEGERRRLFAAAALLMVVAAVLLSATSQPREPDRSGERPPTRPTVVEPAPSPSPPPGSEGLEGADGPEGEAPERVERAARRFLDGYLAYLYGQGDAEAIEAASPTLARRLRREAPRVSPATRQRDPRVVGLGARRLESDRYQVTATIADGGVADYPIELTIARQSGQWRVTSTAAD